MRFTQMVALLVLPFILGGTSCAQTSKEKQKQVVVRVTTHDGAWLGVTLSDMTPKTAKDMEAKTESGALVRSVSEDSPAEKAGIKEDDIVIEFNGKPIADSDDLVKAVGGAKAGETVDLVVVRKDDKKTLKATLAEAPPPPEPIMVTVPHAPDVNVFMRHGSQGAYGLSLRTLNRQLGEYFGAPGGHGVLVEEVRKKSPATAAGFKAGDVIVKVGDETVESVGELHEALGDYKKGETASVAILRKGSKMTLKLPIEESSVGSFYHVDPSDVHHDFNFDLQTPHPFDEEAFQIKMKKFGNEMKEMGKRLKEELKGVEEKVRLELRRVSEI
jgi:C-terminal processing protease CtpA/Prc